ncbi:oxidoreductase [Brevibacillus agri]|uniref:Oxidoreductase n=1 Tax=Brevibacillus agri TaxID=51101 RepID=A0A3M8AUS3_9BACL|nr:MULTISPECIES: Gfo/Idh/MocA family oxidoreductase [Brevibacillus]ELK41889.1 oxidoreductase domain-containing protein [Brevibacillus agri BAB-2500]EJL45621.1 putative dehydrogenase [Brevibacillus sp. CF112]MBG9566892.1 oxidoreductase [Brevibacillus agri]MBY0054240.1 Gfo/Idh/MocA family oxidoreductase [Brevibacillus agri]MDN4094725.1 Gfo/Idh/MocA family oxidoreductase [Brevibacillus agri]
MEKVKVAVIGAGSISDMHLQSYQQNDRAQLQAVVDFNEARAKEKAEKYEAAAHYSNLEEALADPQIDAVSICTWNNTHADIAVSALRAGKHVLLEKPLSTSVESALLIEEAVKQSGKRLQVGFVRRYDTNAQLLKQFIDAGELGEIYYAKASCLRRLGNPGGWFADKERSGGGPLIDLGVHVIDLCWYLMGCPKVATVSGNTYNKLGNRAHVKNLSFYKAADYDPSKNTVEDMANALIRFENGASLFVDVSYTLHAKKEELAVKLYGDKGGAEVEPELSIITEKHDTILNVTPQIDKLSFDFKQGFQNEIDHFISYILGEKETLSPVEHGVEMMKILCGIYESAQTGREVVFSS